MKSGVLRLLTCVGCIFVSMTLAHCGPRQDITSSETAMPAVEEPQSQIESRFDVEVVGQGPQVLLIPGLASSPDVWDHLKKHLSPSYELHILHVHGFDGVPAGKNVEPGSLRVIANQVTEYARNLDKPIVIGHSMGGLLALLVGIEDSSTVSGIMPIDVLPFFSVLMNPLASAESIVPEAVAAKERMLAMTDEQFAAYEDETMKRLTRSDENVKLAAGWATNSDRQAISTIMYDVLTTDLRQDVAKITVPVTVVYAFDEAMGFPEAAVNVLYSLNYGALKGVDLRMVKDARHYVMLDQPEAFKAEIDRFIDRIHIPGVAVE